MVSTESHISSNRSPQMSDFNFKEQILVLINSTLYAIFGPVHREGKKVSHILYINRSRPFDPATFVGKSWEIAEQEDERSLALNEIDLALVQFETCLKDDEEYIKGDEKLKRLKEMGCIRLDAKIFQTLWENQHLIPRSWKEKTNNLATCIFFDGTIIRSQYGLKYILFLCFEEDRWIWRCRYLGSSWLVHRPSAVLADKFKRKEIRGDYLC